MPRKLQLTRLQTVADELNRYQDMLGNVLNPWLKQLDIFHLGDPDPWEDIQGDVSQGNAAGALTREALRNTPFLVDHFRHDQDDSLHFKFQMSHTWNRGIVRPHLHVMPAADPTTAQNVRFAGQWAWASTRVQTPLTASWTSFTVDVRINQGDVFKEKLVPLFETPVISTSKESDVLLVYVYRHGTSPLDTYTTSKAYGTAQANLVALYGDAHYQRVKFGTRYEYSDT